MRELTVYDVRCLPGDSAFLLDDGETAILVDSGFGFTGYRVADNIKKVLGERKLDYIFLTHSHYDHALGSAYILRRYPAAVVVAGSYAASIFPRSGALRVMRELDSKFAAECGAGEYEFLGEELRVDIPAEDGDMICAGSMEFQVINLPGHTRCSVGYYCADRKLLIATESLGVYDGAAGIVPSYLVSYEDVLCSADRMAELEIDAILSPHFGLLDREQTAFFLENAKRCAVDGREFLLAMAADGKTDEEMYMAFRERYGNEYILSIYPDAAMRVNTKIMVDMLKRTAP